MKCPYCQSMLVMESSMHMYCSGCSFHEWGIGRHVTWIAQTIKHIEKEEQEIEDRMAPSLQSFLKELP